jgi:hypothetical protein
VGFLPLWLITRAAALLGGARYAWSDRRFRRSRDHCY